MTRALVIGGIAGALLFCTKAYAVGAASSAPGTEEYQDCQKLIEAKDYPGAEEKCRKAIQLDPQMVDAYTQLGVAMFPQKKYVQAVSELRKCPTQTDVGLRQQLGLNLYKSAATPPAESITLLEGVVKERPTEYAAQLFLGLYFNAAEPKKAIPAFESYLKNRADPSLDDQINSKLGVAYLRVADWDAAQRVFEGMLKTKPNDFAAKIGLGTAYVGKDECSKAIVLYERLLNEAQKQPSIYYNLGHCYLNNKRPADAAREAELYVRAKPADVKGYVLLGDGMFEQKNNPAALGAYMKASQIDTQSATVKAKLGKTYVAMKNYNAALTVLEQARAGTPNDVDVLCALAEAYAAVNAPKDKLNTVAAQLAAMTKDGKAQYSAGVAYFAAGNDEASTGAYRQALKIDSGNGEAKKALVRVLNRRGQLAVEKNDLVKAQNFLEEASNLQPDNTMTNRNLGLVLIATKHYPEAETMLQRGLKKMPEDIVLNRLFGRALVAQSKLTEAVKAYESAVKPALRVRGVDLAGVYTELGPLYLEDPARIDQAVSVLEVAVREAGPGALLQVAQRNLGIALFRRGTANLRDPKLVDSALDDIVKATQMPQVAFTAKEQVTLACGEAFAALKAGKVQEAEGAFARASNNCQVRPPYDKLGAALFAAYAGYRDTGNPGKRESACKTFQSLQSKASGAAAEWVKRLSRSCFELLAYDYFERSDEKKAEGFLKSARKVPDKSDARDLDHNQAVIDLMSGRGAQAEKTFAALNGRPCEALINQGILRDRAGDARKALELYKRALDKGCRAPKLKEWIDVKERLFEAKP